MITTRTRGDASGVACAYCPDEPDVCCTECDVAGCESCLTVCFVCEKPYCRSCTKPCAECGSAIGERCNDCYECCEECGRIICSPCYSELDECRLCFVKFCTACEEKDPKRACGTCRRDTCTCCLTRCRAECCGEELCDECVDEYRSHCFKHFDDLCVTCGTVCEFPDSCERCKYDK